MANPSYFQRVARQPLLLKTIRKNRRMRTQGAATRPAKAQLRDFFQTGYLHRTSQGRNQHQASVSRAIADTRELLVQHFGFDAENPVPSVRLEIVRSALKQGDLVRLVLNHPHWQAPEMEPAVRGQFQRNATLTTLEALRSLPDTNLAGFLRHLTPHHLGHAVWCKNGEPVWFWIIPTLTYAFTTLLGHEIEDECPPDRAKEIENVLPGLTPGKMAHADIGYGFQLGAGIFQSLKEIGYSFAEVIVHTLRHHPEAAIAQHFRNIETYHLPAKSRNVWLVKGKFEQPSLDKMKRAIEEGIEQLEPQSGQTLKQGELRDVALRYCDATLGRGLFEELKKRDQKWQDHLPAYALGRGRSIVIQRKPQYRTTEEMALGFLSHFPEQNVESLSNWPSQLLLTTTQMQEAVRWWQSKLHRESIDFDPQIHYEPYQIVAHCLRCHPDPQIAEYFSRLQPFHFRLTKPSFWVVNGKPHRNATRQALWEALCFSPRVFGIDPQADVVTWVGQLKSALPNLSQKALARAQIDYGKPLGEEIFRAHARIGHSWQELLLDMLHHFPDPDLQEVFLTWDSTVFAKTDRPADRRQKQRSEEKRCLEILHDELQIEERTAAERISLLLNNLNSELVGRIKARIPTAPAGGIGVLLVRTLKRHPEKTVRDFFKNLHLYHIQGEARWVLKGELNRGEIRAALIEALELDVSEDPDQRLEGIAFCHAVQERLPHYNATSLTGVSLGYGAQLDSGLFRAGQQFQLTAGDLITDALQNHPNKTVRNYFALLRPFHFRRQVHWQRRPELLAEASSELIIRAALQQGGEDPIAALTRLGAELATNPEMNATGLIRDTTLHFGRDSRFLAMIPGFRNSAPRVLQFGARSLLTLTPRFPAELLPLASSESDITDWFAEFSKALGTTSWNDPRNRLLGHFMAVRNPQAGLSKSFFESELMHYYTLATTIADQMARGLPPSVNRTALHNFALDGLFDALRGFNPLQGTSFQTYARHRIRGAVIDGLRSMDHLTRSTRTALNRVLALQIEAQDQTPSIEVIALRTGMPRKKVVDLLTIDRIDRAMKGQESAFSNEGQSNGEPLSLAQRLTDPAWETKTRQPETRDFLEMLIRRYAQDPRDQDVIRLYHFENLTEEEIATRHKVTASRISQILNRFYRDASRYSYLN